MSFIPHTEEETQEMLNSLGLSRLEDLFDEIPDALKSAPPKGLPEPMNEMTLLRHARVMAEKNKHYISFMGAGSYDHHIPSAVWDIATRGEFLTSYTPYQAEASQGTLQLIYEFQTMIAELTGMEVSNASLYDGSTALTEAVLMARRLKSEVQNPIILVPETIHPFYRKTLETIVSQQSIRVQMIAMDTSGRIDLSALYVKNTDNVIALILPLPNFFGLLESVDELCDFAHTQQWLTIACVNPIALGLIKPPSEWGQAGVDIVCGEAQPLGIPMTSGGPYLGFLSSKIAYIRQMPGRIVGKTEDLEGKTGFTLTLQAREQHIRRGKATSNICTNQGLLVTAATIHMSLLGPEGLARVASLCHHQTCLLVERLTAIPGISLVFDTPYFHEALLHCNKPIGPLMKRLQDRNILGGLAIETYYPDLKNTFLICATEQRTLDDIERFQSITAEYMTDRGPYVNF